MFKIVLDLPSVDNSERISKRMSSGISRQRYRTADWQAWQKDPYLRPRITYMETKPFVCIYLPSCKRKLPVFILEWKFYCRFWVVPVVSEVLERFVSNLEKCVREKTVAVSLFKWQFKYLDNLVNPNTSQYCTQFFLAYCLQGDNVWIPLAKPAKLKR
jgi:hypothetical protein